MRSPIPGRVVRALGGLVLAAGLLLALGSAVAGGAGGQERIGIGLALVMAGVMVLVLGNYLHHAAVRSAGEEDPDRARGDP